MPGCVDTASLLNWGRKVQRAEASTVNADHGAGPPDLGRPGLRARAHRPRQPGQLPGDGGLPDQPGLAAGRRRRIDPSRRRAWLIRAQPGGSGAKCRPGLPSGLWRCCTGGATPSGCKRKAPAITPRAASSRPTRSCSRTNRWKCSSASPRACWRTSRPRLVHRLLAGAPRAAGPALDRQHPRRRAHRTCHLHLYPGVAPAIRLLGDLIYAAQSGLGRLPPDEQAYTCCLAWRWAHSRSEKEMFERLDVSAAGRGCGRKSAPWSSTPGAPRTRDGDPARASKSWTGWASRHPACCQPSWRRPPATTSRAARAGLHYPSRQAPVMPRSLAWASNPVKARPKWTWRKLPAKMVQRPCALHRPGRRCPAAGHPPGRSAQAAACPTSARCRTNARAATASARKSAPPRRRTCCAAASTERAQPGAVPPGRPLRLDERGRRRRAPGADDHLPGCRRAGHPNRDRLLRREQPGRTGLRSRRALTAGQRSGQGADRRLRGLDLAGVPGLGAAQG